jgi:hypothetical protein
MDLLGAEMIANWRVPIADFSINNRKLAIGNWQ